MNDHIAPRLAELASQRAAIDKEMAEIREGLKQQAVREIRETMLKHGVSVEDLKPRNSNYGRPIPPRYRDPESGSTWSGRGKQPAWLQGKNPADFLIK